MDLVEAQIDTPALVANLEIVAQLAVGAERQMLTARLAVRGPLARV